MFVPVLIETSYHSRSRPLRSLPAVRSNRAGQTDAALRPPAPAAVQPMPWEDRIELTYTQMLRTPQEVAAAGQGQISSETSSEHSWAKELPEWAQNVLRQNGGQLPQGVQSDRFRRTASAGQQSGTGNGQINWSAPYAFPPGAHSGAEGAAAAGQSPMVFRQKDSGEPESSPRRQEIDERTVRSMADKVYRIIEERLRKELRRGGK